MLDAYGTNTLFDYHYLYDFLLIDKNLIIEISRNNEVGKNLLTIIIE